MPVFSFTLDKKEIAPESIIFGITSDLSISNFRHVMYDFRRLIYNFRQVMHNFVIDFYPRFTES